MIRVGLPQPGGRLVAFARRFRLPVLFSANAFAVRDAQRRFVRSGIIHTDMTAAVAEAYDRLIGEGLIPQGRWGEPEDVGRVVAALARGDAAYSTGAVIIVDGGITIPRL